MTETSATAILPITDADLPVVCEFLRQQFKSPCPLDNWLAGFSHHWHPDKPNNGFMIKDGDQLVGAFGALYSLRTIAGKQEQFCNLTSLYVLENYRSYSLPLIRKLLRQPEFHFTALSANEIASRIYLGMHFKPLPRTAWLSPTLCLPFGSKVLTKTGEIAQVLSAERSKVCLDHADCRSVLQLAVGSEATGYCHVLFRKSYSKRIACANILDVSDVALFFRFRNSICRHFLFGHGCLLLRVGALQLGNHKPAFAISTQEPPIAFYRSNTLTEADMSLLYSEVVALCGC